MDKISCQFNSSIYLFLSNNNFLNWRGNLEKKGNEQITRKWAGANNNNSKKLLMRNGACREECCSRFCFLILVFGCHLFGSAQIDGDAFVLGLLVLDRLAEFLEGRGQGDGQRSGTLAAVADVSVTLERSRRVAHQGRRSDGRVTNDNHRKHPRVDDILSDYK